VRTQDGTILLATIEKEATGYIAGIVAAQSEDDLVECLPTKDGHILDLFVSSEHREKGIGALLLQEMETYFRKHGCGAVWVDCFTPNAFAHQFYELQGYGDRVISMLKKL
jgi:GNAT superfamily N-acetyltransferase